MPWREFEKRLRNDDDFAKLVEYGRLAQKAWWLRNARLNIKDKSFQFSLWFAVMKNKYGWADKIDNVNREGKPLDQVSNDELEQRVAETLARSKGKLSKLLSIKNVEIDEDGSSQVS